MATLDSESSPPQDGTIISAKVEVPAMPTISAVPGFHFTKPLSISIEHEGEGSGYWLARIAALDLWADGETEEEALSDLRDSLAKLTADLWDAPLATLGSGPQRWQAYLRRVAVKTS